MVLLEGPYGAVLLSPDFERIRGFDAALQLVGHIDEEVHTREPLHLVHRGGCLRHGLFVAAVAVDETDGLLLSLLEGEHALEESRGHRHPVVAADSGEFAPSVVEWSADDIDTALPAVPSGGKPSRAWPTNPR